MADIQKFIRELEQERDVLAGKLQEVNEALNALRKVSGVSSSAGRGSKKSTSKPTTRRATPPGEETPVGDEKAIEAYTQLASELGINVGV